jgi:hypothetical protein
MSRAGPLLAKSTMGTRSSGLHLLGLGALVLLSSCGARSQLIDEGGDDGSVPPPAQEDDVAGDAAGLVDSTDTDSPDTDSTDTAVSEDAGHSNPGPMPDAGGTPPAVDDASTCIANGGGGGSGNGACEESWGEMCGSTNYQVDCTCPRGSCTCFGPTTHVVQFTGCPACPSGSFADVFALCGFPHAN